MRKAIVVLGILAVGCLGVIGFFRLMYPFGDRPGTTIMLHGELITYAQDHGGWFPKSQRGSYDALQQLYPNYCSATGRELAGVSGNIDRTVRALHEGRTLDQTLTSWVYVPGFRLDDAHDLAILWESKGGLYASGWRSFDGGHAVLLIGGPTNVPGTTWESFLSRQEELRKTVLANRASATNTLPKAPAP